jgi:hypothetical protein
VFILTFQQVASGALYESDASKESFDIRTLFPQMFEFRSDVYPLMEVSPIPHQLQGEIELGLKKPKSQHDLAHLFSQDHLQFLYSRFLSPNRERNAAKDSTDQAEGNGRGGHRMWTQAADIVKRSSSTKDIPVSPEGMSTTVNEHIRLLSTAVGNLWDSSIYKKSLDYILRILLRLHLAPDRESRYWDRTHNVAQSQAKEKGSKGGRKRWKRKVKDTCDRLAHLINKDTINERAVSAVVSSLQKIASQKPASIQSKIPHIECRLEEVAMAKETDERCRPGILDDEDEEADEENEDENEDNHENAMKIDGKFVFDSLRGMLIQGYN